MLPDNPRNIDTLKSQCLRCALVPSMQVALIEIERRTFSHLAPHAVLSLHICLARTAKHSFLAPMRSKPMRPASSCLSHSAVFPFFALRPSARANTLFPTVAFCAHPNGPVIPLGNIRPVTAAPPQSAL